MPRVNESGKWLIFLLYTKNTIAPSPYPTLEDMLGESLKRAVRAYEAGVLGGQRSVPLRRFCNHLVNAAGSLEGGALFPKLKKAREKALKLLEQLFRHSGTGKALDKDNERRLQNRRLPLERVYDILARTFFWSREEGDKEKIGISPADRIMRWEVLSEFLSKKLTVLRECPCKAPRGKAKDRRGRIIQECYVSERALPWIGDDGMKPECQNVDGINQAGLLEGKRWYRRCLAPGLRDSEPNCK